MVVIGVVHVVFHLTINWLMFAGQSVPPLCNIQVYQLSNEPTNTGKRPPTIALDW